jgi:hypothetical protein
MRIPISLEPFLLEKSEFAKLESDLSLLLSATKKIANAYYTDSEIRDIISISADEQDLIQSAREKDFSGIIRVDLFYSDSPKIVEINSDYPDGFFMHDITATAIRNSFSETLGAGLIASTSHAEIFSKLLTDSAASKEMHIFIGHDRERTFIDEFHLTKNKLAELGWNNISVGTLEVLEYRGGNLYFNNKKIDALRRGSELSKIRRMPNLIPWLIEAEKNGLIVINNFKIRLLGYKSLLAAMWDEKSHRYLNEPEIKSIKKLVPETYKLDSPYISKNKLTENKDIWVLKPIDLAEGSDVFVGSSCTATDWASALERAYKNPTKWIVQHKVKVPEATFNLIEKNHTEITSYNRKYDCNPHIILNGDNVELGAILVRFSESSILNVTKGGGITYAFPQA